MFYATSCCVVLCCIALCCGGSVQCTFDNRDFQIYCSLSTGDDFTAVATVAATNLFLAHSPAHQPLQVSHLSTQGLQS